MGSATLLLTLSTISLLTPPSTAALGFTCTSAGPCRALIDYVSPNTTYLSVIRTRFGIPCIGTLLGANNYPDWTSPSQSVIAGDTIKIPIPCICTKGSGISNKVPIYTVQPNDSLDHIAVDVFSRLVTDQQIQEANNISNAKLIEIGQNLTIPLPCSCDAVNGLEVVHYGHVVKSGNSVEQIAEEYNTTQETLLQLNGLTDPKDLQAGAVLDVPLKVCSSKVQNDSLDYPLLVSNNTYVYTANNCVECKCDSANDWTLQCDRVQTNTADGTCSSMQCQLGSHSLDIGNATSSASCTMCAYAGYYANQTILTTTVNESTCPESMGNSRQRQKRIVIATLVSTFSGILLLGLVCLWRIIREKRRKRRAEERDNPERANPERGYTTEDLELPLFNLAAVSKATKNFSFNNKLGEGGFGPVYKGVLEDGQEIAVKRLSVDSRQGLNEFKNEAIHIVKLQHRNLVKLLGYCIQGDEKMLIYEFMPNKSLDFFIFDRTQSILLDWPRRFHIINGIAQGLLYLHRDSRLRIIHRDLKASNILLDNEMNPKISDFGLARSFSGSESPANTNKVVGTYGYMSPEYAIDGLYSVKSDVFSFGVLLLEVVSGKRNRGFYHPEHHLKLIGHAWRLHIEGKSLEMMDESIRDSHNLSEVLRSIHVGLLCVQRDPEDRPSMSSVVLMLGGEGALPQPRQPGFYNERNLVEGDSSSVMCEEHSANEITITLFQAR